MPSAHTVVFGIYVAVGPAAWVIYAYLTSVARERMTRLKYSRAALPVDPPAVSILVPARNEAAHIRHCIERVLRQDYPYFEVIAIDDRSEDATAAILDQIAIEAPRVRAIHVANLPLGWLGKCHALERGAEYATGEWLFFVDSDVKLKPDALSKMMALALSRNYDAMSIMTAIEANRFIEKLMLPLLAATWMAVFTGDQTNEESEPDKALANGQAMLIRAEPYRDAGGHAAVKDRIVEDVELMRLLKSKKRRVRFFAGRHLASTRMHTHLTQMFHGWARIFAGTARGSVWPMLVSIGYLLTCVLSVYPALGYAIATGSVPWLIAAGVHWVVMTTLYGFVWFWCGNAPVYALLLPISVPIEISILLYSIRKAISGEVNWRGTAVNVRETSKGSPQQKSHA